MSSRRLPVTLEVSDVRAIESFLEPGRPENEMLHRWADAHQMPVVASQSAVIRLLARVGAESLHQQAIEAGYAKLAEQNSRDRALEEERRERRDRNRARRSA